MKLLVYEYITGGGHGLPPNPALIREGDLMLSALTTDLAAIPGLELLVLRDERLMPFREHPHIHWIPVGTEVSAMGLFSTLLDQVDAAWPVAPETDGILEELCRRIETRGRILFNTSARGVRLAASKLATLAILEQAHIPLVPTQAWSVDEDSPPVAFPIVIKTDDGVACENTTIIRNTDQWSAFRQQARPGDWIIQPLVSGETLSLCGLFRAGDGVLLSVNRQLMGEHEQGFSLAGCQVNAIADESGHFAALIQAIARAIPDLWGYAGVDLIRTEHGLQVLEINPRLTSSYAGLRAALNINPARLVIDLCRQPCLPRLSLSGTQAVDVVWGSP
ncbi:MAG: ATP-grasp domain-containing protein [Methylococcus sp.]